MGHVYNLVRYHNNKLKYARNQDQIPRLINMPMICHPIRPTTKSFRWELCISIQPEQLRPCAAKLDCLGKTCLISSALMGA